MEGYYISLETRKMHELQNNEPDVGLQRRPTRRPVQG